MSEQVAVQLAELLWHILKIRILWLHAVFLPVLVCRVCIVPLQGIKSVSVDEKVGIPFIEVTSRDGGESVHVTIPLYISWFSTCIASLDAACSSGIKDCDAELGGALGLCCSQSLNILIDVNPVVLVGERRVHEDYICSAFGISVHNVIAA